MTAYYHHSISPACSTLVPSRALWACDSTRMSSRGSRDKKWEVDSMAEVSGT